MDDLTSPLLERYPVIGVQGRDAWDRERDAARLSGRGGPHWPLHGDTLCFFCLPFAYRPAAHYVVSQIVAGALHHATACTRHAARAEVLCRQFEEIG